MPSSKAQSVKGDKETIIDMEPVKEASYIKNFINFPFFISVLTLVLTSLTLGWIIFYYIPKLSETEIRKIDNLIEQVNKINKQDNNISEINDELKVIKTQISKISKNENPITQVEFQNLYSSVISLKKEINDIAKTKSLIKINNDTLDLKKNNKVEIKNNLDLINNNNSTKNFSNIKKNNPDLILETQMIIDKLLARNDFGSIPIEEIHPNELSYFSRLKNYLAGFLKLRQYSNDLTPRSIITNAEIELKKGNLVKCLNLLKTLPEHWKVSINEFIIKTEIYLKNR